MKLEHFALQVSDPVALADWYVKHLGLRVARSAGEPTHARFLLDDSGAIMLEVYRNPRVEVPDYRRADPLLMHIALQSEEPARERDALIKAGATLVEELQTSAAGDELVMLRDPWDIPLQLVKRAKPMLESQSRRGPVSKTGSVSATRRKSSPEKFVLYQKPTCSTCREAVKLLDANGATFTSVDYFQQRLKASEIKGLLKKLGLPAMAIVRTKEPLAQKLGIGRRRFTENQLIGLLAKYPELIQRPILVRGSKAVLGRPVEELNRLL